MCAVLYYCSPRRLWLITAKDVKKSGGRTIRSCRLLICPEIGHRQAKQGHLPGSDGRFHFSVTRNKVVQAI